MSPIGNDFHTESINSKGPEHGGNYGRTEGRYHNPYGSNYQPNHRWLYERYGGRYGHHRQGGQEIRDFNHNGRIDGGDFKMAQRRGSVFDNY